MFDNITRIAKYFNSKELSDVKLQVSDSKEIKEYYAHKFVLGSQSDVFKKMLFGSLAESKLDTIEIKDTDVETFELLLSYMYTGTATLTIQNVVDLLLMSDYYDTKGLTKKCEEFLIENTTNVEGVGRILPYAVKYSMASLLEKCQQFITQNTEEFLSSKEFNDLPDETILFILEKFSLYCSEEKIFRSIVSWGKIKQKDDPNMSLKEILSDTLKHIKFPLISPKIIIEEVQPLNIVSYEVLYEALAYSFSPKSFDETKPQFQHRIKGGQNRLTLERTKQIVSGWGYSGSPDVLEMTVTKSILLSGIGAFGGSGQTKVQLTLKDGGNELITKSFTFMKNSSQSNEIEPLLFDSPIRLKANNRYTIIVLQTGPTSSYLSGAETTIEKEGVKFEFFTSSWQPSNGTSNTSGQIPSIYFYV